MVPGQFDASGAGRIEGKALRAALREQGEGCHADCVIRSVCCRELSEWRARDTAPNNGYQSA
jgi:hypothetical protein